jgi:hypothetical protein
MHNIMDLTANARIAPSWGPEKDSEYSFRSYRADVLMWQASTDIEVIRQGPSLVLRLTGGARELMREYDVNLIINGETYYDANGAVASYTSGVDYVIRCLQNRYAPLEQEIQIGAISDLFTFTRETNETVDHLLARYDIVRHRAENLGQARFPVVARAWILLSGMKVPRDKWSMFLHQFQSRLPVTEEEYAALVNHLRRDGHLYDKGDKNKSIQQPYFNTPDDQADDNTYWSWPSTSSSWQRQDQLSSTVYFQDDDDNDFSSCCSLDEEDLVWEDLDEFNDNEAGEHLYLAYRFAKRRWRSFAGRPFNGRGKGK